MMLMMMMLMLMLMMMRMMVMMMMMDAASDAPRIHTVAIHTQSPPGPLSQAAKNGNEK